MSEKSILFNADEVRAALAGHKTQVRRPVKPQPPGDARATFAFDRARLVVPATFASESSIPDYDCEIMTPWLAGDLLWVRETWTAPAYEDWKMSEMPQDIHVRYKATDKNVNDERYTYKWRPSIHMPRWASRLTLRVKRVWVEQAQDISKQDAIAEGVYWSEAFPEMYTWQDHHRGYGCAEHAFFAMYGFDCMGDINPHLWACEFEMVNE
ncbi:unnamed protein product [marine sediment metagenome]|uniref:Uncharacterized protein n=1 Tax=marine sediment metagenome TaxID=412755 RepID=X0Z0M0_9ZZZZ